MVSPMVFPHQLCLDLEIYGDFAKSKRFFLFGHFREESGGTLLERLRGEGGGNRGVFARKQQGR